MTGNRRQEKLCSVFVYKNFYQTATIRKPIPSLICFYGLHFFLSIVLDIHFNIRLRMKFTLKEKVLTRIDILSEKDCIRES